jgi:hypothetical protein
MAAAKKSQPLTLEDLLDAQLKMLKDPALSEGQREQAKKQIEILEGIRTGINIGNIDALKENSDVRTMTRAKGNSTTVTLGDVRDEVRGMRQDLKLVNADGNAPAENRRPLPKLGFGQVIDVPARDITAETADVERTERLQKIGGLLEQKTGLARGGSRNENLNTRNAQAFERFVLETKDRQKLLADADQNQQQIFQRLEDTLIQLKEADTEQSKALIQEMARLKGALKETSDTEARGKIDKTITGAMRSAQQGSTQQHGTLGDAFAALRGKREVLKAGYRRDERTGRVHEVDPETGQIGKMVKARDASMGRLGGAANILGSFAMNKFEQNLESKRDPAWQDFFDNFRQTENARGSAATRLPEVQGQLDAVMGKEPDAQAKPQKLRPELRVIPGGLAGTGARAGAGRMQAQVISITGNVVNIKGGEIRGLEGPDNRFKGAGSRAGVKSKGEEEKKAGAAEEGGGGGLLDAALDIGGSLLGGGKKVLGKAGGMLKGAGSKVLGAGKMLAGGVKGALGTAGGATLATGAAMVAAPFVADYVAGKFGVGKDEKGNDLVIDEKQDDANWERASLWEKIQSAPARGIEKIGGLFGGNIATEARAKRISQETEYLNKKQGTAQPAQPKAEAKPATPMAGKPVDTAKAQAAAKEKYQAAKTEEAKAAEKLAAFEKENQFDYREKPTAEQEFLEVPGTGKFKDPKKQAEYDKLRDTKYKAQEDKQRAGQDYTKAEGVTKTWAFGGGTGKPGEGTMSDAAKIAALKKRGYTDEQLGRDDSLTQNYIGIGGAKYSSTAMGKYEAEIKKELDSPVQGKDVGAKASATVRDEKVGALSANIAAQRDSAQSKPVVINNATPAPAAPPATQTFAPRGSVRGDESALDNFHKSRTQYYW